MKNVLPLLALALLCSITCNAQYFVNQNKVWAFGSRAGLDFSSGTPTAIRTSINSSEACASIADASGALLFYTDGKKVWDRAHNVMTSGSSIAPYNFSSSTQGALIMQKPGSTTNYYIFSLEEYGALSTRQSHLVYCEVDMTLSSGMGDVVSSTIATPLDSLLSEKMTAIRGVGCQDLWLLYHSRDSSIFYARKVNASGISAPVVSRCGRVVRSRGSYAYFIGTMIASPNDSLIGMQVHSPSSNLQGTSLFDFDPATGIVSNCRDLDTVNVGYSCEFSPDSKVFYALTLPPSYASTSIYQFDATLSSTTAIVASRTTIRTGSGDSQMKLGPDGKIYFVSISGGSGSNLDCIPSPNSLGTGCGYTSRAVTLVSGTNCSEGMPNIVVVGGTPTVTAIRSDTTFCIPTGDSVAIQPDSVGISYAWDDGDTAFNHFIYGPGTYIVAINRSCDIIYDTIVVQSPPASNFSFRHDTTVCAIRAPINITDRAGLTGYTWNAGATGRTLNVTTTGVYYVVAHDSCNNNYIDTFHVTLTIPDTTHTPTADTSLCVSFAPLNLNGRAGFSSYTWSTGSTAPNISVLATGIYWVRKTTGCSIVIDTFRVNFIPFPAFSLGVDRFTCIGDTIILSSTITPNSTNLWNDGTTRDSLFVITSGTYWLQVDNGCRTTDTINITFSLHPLVNAGRDTINCTSQPILLQSLSTYTAPTYAWSNGANTDTTTAYTSGLYWLTVTVAGCSATDSVRVTIYNDTFSLANRDTAICKGRQVQALLTANPAATFQWLPTAGIANSTVANPLIRPDTTAMYKVYIYLNPCPVLVDSFLIDVQPIPTVYAGGNIALCQFDTIKLHAAVSPVWYNSYWYDWSPNLHIDNFAIQDPIFTAGATQKYIVTVTTPAGCIGKDSTVVTVNPGNFALVSPDKSLCPGDSVQFIASGGDTYRWYPSMYLSDSTSPTPWVHAITSQHYMLIATSAAGCTDTIMSYVNVFPAAVFYLADSVHVYPGESVQLSVQTNCSNVSWFPPQDLDNPLSSNPIATPTSSTVYAIKGMTENGCVATDSIDVIVMPESVVIAPNAFTPGLPINSIFTINYRGIATLNHFRIYNRWGNLLFESKDINTGWDGTYNGTPQPFGVYVYDFEAVTNTGKLVSRHGNVTLVR